MLTSRRLWLSLTVIALAEVPLAGRILGNDGSDAPAVRPIEPRLIEQPRSEYQARRQELMRRVKDAESSRSGFARGEPRVPLIVLRGGDNQDREDFEEGRFRQTNWFAYLTGVEIPGAYLILLPTENRATLYLPPGPIGHPVMNGEWVHARPGPEAAEWLGFDQVESTGKLLGDLFTILDDPMRPGFGRSSHAAVYMISPNPKDSDTSPLARFVRLLREGAPSTDFRDVATILGELRKVKSNAELAILQKAIDITGEAQKRVVESIRPGLVEYQLEGKILGAFLDGGALRPGFASIVGSGPNATIPHYFDNNRKLEDGDLVVVDIGAEYQYYTADITRTYPANGRFTPRQRELYQLVLDAQEYAANQMTRGKTRLGEMTGVVRAYLRKSPLRARDQDGKEQTMDRFFIHGLSHYLGMDVHDVGDMSKPIEVGEVFTIEPGLYIKSENIGIRIEDDYVMTEDGPLKLSKAIPSDPDAIEKAIAEAREKADAKALEVGAGSR